MSTETNNLVQDKLITTFGAIFNFKQDKDILPVEIPSNKINAILLFLKNDPDLNFHFLTDLCAVHYPDNAVEQQFAVVYHIHNWYKNERIKLKTFISGTTPEIKTVSNIFPCANWMERESWDFYGINFIGHPQLKRILNMDEMVSHPMRKEFPLEDGGRTDKDDRFFGRTVGNN